MQLFITHLRFPMSLSWCYFIMSFIDWYRYWLCTKIVKYLGVKVTSDKKEQTKVAKEQIDKNIKVMRWRLGSADSDVIQQLIFRLSRSIHIYIYTTIIISDILRRSDIDRIEASLYRKVLRVWNMISNKAILHTITSIRLEGEVTNYWLKGAC